MHSVSKINISYPVVDYGVISDFYDKRTISVITLPRVSIFFFTEHVFEQIFTTQRLYCGSSNTQREKPLFPI